MLVLTIQLGVNNGGEKTLFYLRTDGRLSFVLK